MKNTKNKIKKLRHDICWYHALYTLEDLRNYTYFADKEFNRLLSELISYVDEKISTPPDSGAIIAEYVVVEYQEKLGDE